MAKKQSKKVAANDEWPLPLLSFFCEKILEDRDGVFTAVRIVDNVRLPHNIPLPERGMIIPMPIMMAIGFKSGRALGKRSVEISVTSPEGKTEKLAEVEATFLKANG